MSFYNKDDQKRNNSEQSKFSNIYSNLSQCQGNIIDKYYVILSNYDSFFEERWVVTYCLSFFMSGQNG